MYIVLGVEEAIKGKVYINPKAPRVYLENEKHIISTIYVSVEKRQFVFSFSFFP